MEAAVVLLTLACYSCAYFLWWRYGTPIFFFTLLAGHVGALASPLWMILYGVAYRTDLAVLSVVLDQPLLRAVFIASAWYYTLPAMVIFALYRFQWWSPGYVAGLITYGCFVLYHLALEVIGLRLNLWSYSAIGALPFGVPHALLSALMAALISLGLLYVLLIVERFAWASKLLVLVPGVLLLSLVVYGVLGAPLWFARLLSAQELLATQNWAVSIGMVSTVILLVWAIHIIAHGLKQVDQRFYGET